MPEYPKALKLAENLARVGHHGQTDKNGRDYIEHVIEVVKGLRGTPYEASDVAKAAAWMHDLVEDTTWTVDMLSRRGRAVLPEPRQKLIWGRAVGIVEALTHAKHEPRADYYARIVARGQYAVAVKLADIDSNTRPERLAQLDPETRTRLETKYAEAREALRPAKEQEG